MKTGILFSNQSKFSEAVKKNNLEKLINDHSSTAFESGILSFVKNKSRNDLSMRCLISYYLGAKKLQVKINEIKLVLESGIKDFILFPDIQNIKFNEFHHFQTELTEICKIVDSESISLFLPIDVLEENELVKILKIITEMKIKKIVVGNPINEEIFIDTNMIDKLKKIISINEDLQLLCILSKNEYVLEDYQEKLKELGINEVLFYIQ